MADRPRPLDIVPLPRTCADGRALLGDVAMALGHVLEAGDPSDGALVQGAVPLPPTFDAGRGLLDGGGVLLDAFSRGENGTGRVRVATLACAKGDAQEAVGLPVTRAGGEDGLATGGQDVRPRLVLAPAATDVGLEALDVPKVLVANGDARQGRTGAAVLLHGAAATVHLGAAFARRAPRLARPVGEVAPLAAPAEDAGVRPTLAVRAAPTTHMRQVDGRPEDGRAFQGGLDTPVPAEAFLGATGRGTLGPEGPGEVPDGLAPLVPVQGVDRPWTSPVPGRAKAFLGAHTPLVVALRPPPATGAPRPAAVGLLADVLGTACRPPGTRDVRPRPTFPSAPTVGETGTGVPALVVLPSPT